MHILLSRQNLTVSAKGSILAGLLLVLFALPVAAAQSDTDAPPPPLFPVGLGHRFPDAAQKFDAVRRLILEQYYSDQVSEEALYWAAIQGMLRHISPPRNRDLARIWTPAEYNKVRERLQGNHVSIGIKSSFNSNDGSLTVTEVLPGSPAESLLRPYDRILRINGQSLDNTPLDELNGMLDGDENTVVTLTLNRGLRIFDVTVPRKKFKLDDLVVNRLTDTIALVEIKQFTAGVAAQLKDELLALPSPPLQGVIIDLRNNQGGVFMEGLRMAELFLPDNSVLLRTYQRDTGMRNYVSTDREPFDLKIAILINHKTASAAEALAVSLRDHEKAFLIGSRSHGKGVFEKTHTLDHDFRVKFITGVMYSPKGNPWQNDGLAPDFLVEQDEAALASLAILDMRQRLRRDVAIITAIKLLNHSY